MAGHGRGAKPERAPLNRDRVVAAAVAVADEKGTASGATMRAIAARLNVEAMSLYNHVSGRDDILDGMVDAVFGEIDLPEPGTPWKQAMHDRAASSRAALLRHPWAVGLMDSRNRPGPNTLRHHDAVLGSLRAGGFSVPMAGHAFSLLDSYIYGFVIQEVSLPVVPEDDFDEIANEILRYIPAEDLPHLAEFMAHHILTPGYAFADEFEYGLALILDTLRPDET
ncbi:TetR/AcrR family transcriptional regulator C-terminal domain-containing protein [Allonocardiopsis opalescens]|uniref:TetR family transcriptional regulator n=1 Tax=Allonocardiopsis opalescens TaxID=1144618 RepID=A0A2T0PZ61_9ACTN|nr:TetR/AcrR family transcriptional regulator C-terminal domain-containing protein [Allonocardiopsis opalescens]PRX96835.1 TetR family transcriptional regulator [Allonocardiopsis opalescens]